MVSVKRNRFQRGVTLVEVLIVVTIIAVISGGAALLAFPMLQESRVKSAVVGAGEVRSAAEIHIELDGSEGCPSVVELVSAKKLKAGKTDDPWGTPYRVDCSGEDGLHVYSNGRDKQPGTPDDVRDDTKMTDVKRIADL